MSGVSADFLAGNHQQNADDEIVSQNIEAEIYAVYHNFNCPSSFVLCPLQVEQKFKM
jgi:hypothetical protein